MVRLIFILFFMEICDAQCEGYRHNACFGDCEWDKVLKKCTDCKPGYFGKNCGKTCRYPSFGFGCQHNCVCSEDECDLSQGCPKIESTKDAYKTDDGKDIKATPINIQASIATENMGNLTLERAKDTIFLEQFSAWFNTKITSITVVCIVGLILITIVILFTRKEIHKRYSLKRSEKRYECPNDRLSEPVHYEVISNITV